jgi:hypothetical protein
MSANEENVMPIIEDSDGAPISQALQDVIDERSRQISAEGWTEEHDDRHAGGEMARAAACYAAHTDDEQGSYCDPDADNRHIPILWPWAPRWWKPKDRRRDLVRAAALIVAEIERLDRKAERRIATLEAK